ncbi:DUF1002 domain-containing protein [Desmospora profundinema]|uniref:Uncharacterized protein YpuA (DUF1002 family) n=1 Tax=Desmospora profundinema TaxID=1571184 RepID=A0ABU1IPK8_9BACL|nr:DUF1002 domain-containing protein [Desmospora profundinema]MDR6226708.1 uncharacterized protein YpuA (DUF1002 family) [Desmospora profundinema]
MKRLQGYGIFSLIVSLAFGLFAFPLAASAETSNTVVTLGADLSQEQRQAMLDEMKLDSSVDTIDVSIDDIRQYLGKGTSGGTPSGANNKAYSSASITLTEEGNGIRVQAKNVTRVTEQMYANALVTAGVKDADVYVTSPEPVTGTAALTGIMMAFEKASDQTISQEQREVANEEMMQTSELGEKLGDPDKAAEFMNQVKDEIAKQQPKSEEEVRNIIINVAGDLNINLNDQDIQNITNVMYKFSQLNIDWDALGNQLNKLKDALSSEEAQGFFEELWAWLAELFESLKSAFSS